MRASIVFDMSGSVDGLPPPFPSAGGVPPQKKCILTARSEIDMLSSARMACVGGLLLASLAMLLDQARTSARDSPVLRSGPS